MAKNSGYQHGQFVGEGMTGTGMGTAASLASSKTSAQFLEWMEQLRIPLRITAFGGDVRKRLRAIQTWREGDT
ncbi:MAG TPA: hypothetical protein VKB90_08015 [Candidatus Acidoferrum sp.]|nr:hypothetical protein [Candidatus Acidoferrum sp.]